MQGIESAAREHRRVSVDIIAAAIEVIAANGSVDRKAALGISNQEYPGFLKEAIRTILYDRLRHEAAIAILRDYRLYHGSSGGDYDNLAEAADNAARSIADVVVDRILRRPANSRKPKMASGYVRDEHGALRRAKE